MKPFGNLDRGASALAAYARRRRQRIMLPHLAPASHTVAIIGGGFSGAAVAFHLARTASPCPRILVFEPRRVFGFRPRLRRRQSRASDQCHRPAHEVCCPTTAVISRVGYDATGACADDPEAFLPDGRIFPRRAVFGRYVAARLTPFLSAGRINHITERATRLSRRSQGWSIACDHGFGARRHGRARVGKSAADRSRPDRVRVAGRPAPHHRSERRRRARRHRATGSGARDRRGADDGRCGGVARPAWPSRPDPRGIAPGPARATATRRW